MSATFVHLCVHTEYSLVDGLVRVPQLMKSVRSMNMPAVALTDQTNLFAMVKFYRRAIANGIKPIIGVDMRMRAQGHDEGGVQRALLLCRNKTGYANLTRLVTRAYLEGQERGVPILQPEWLDDESSRGLIALSGGRDGAIGRALLAGHEQDARSLAEWWTRRFPDSFYLQVARTGRPGEEAYLHDAVELGAALDLPLVATNEVCFLKQSDFAAHEARVCINNGTTLDDSRRPRHYSSEQYLRSPEEMAELFSDLPEAIENSVLIAKRCNLGLELGSSVLPEFPIPESFTSESFLESEAKAGLAERLGGIEVLAAKPEYAERLATELGVINGMGFPGYFLIVADFIRWSRQNQIPVGPGRGSGAGSLVAYALGITDLDPLEHDLLFERFLNPERVSMPDFDIDFCMEGRDRVIDYVANKYGRDRVSQIITYGSMAARAVVRDTGRVLGHPYGFVDRIAKLIPMELGITLGKSLDQDQELARAYDEDEEVRTLLDLAMQLEGLARNAGKHAGGVVISPSALTDFAPLYCEEGGANVVTQFDKDDVEAVGLVKFDFLGLRTLTIIDWALATINEQRAASGAEPLDMDKQGLADKQAYALLKRCETTAVFQLESRGMKDLVRRLQPDCFEDIVALVALFRPGPLQSGMVDDFIKRKHGEATIDYPHPDLEPILRETYGVILYQEQVMQIAQVLAGYSLGGADLLRRAMGKKKASEMAKQREIFQAGAHERGVDAGVAAHIFDLMEKFAGYGFNKSHSAAYAVLSFQTAWLKAHYPAAFMAAVLSADMDNTDKIVTLIDDCRSLKLTVDPPDINASIYRFSVSGRRAIRYGLGAIKGVGRGAIEAVIEERNANGRFETVADLCRRIDLGRTNRRVLEALVKAGAMDSLGLNRATLMAQFPDAIRAAEQHARDAAAGQNDLFGIASAPADRTLQADARAVAELPEWPEPERLAAEKESLGLYLTGHPIDEFADDLPHLTTGRIGAITSEPPPAERARYAKRTVTVAGLVLDMRKRGNRVSLILDDGSARMEATLFEDVYQRYAHIVAKDVVLIVEGTVRFDDFVNEWRLAVRTILDIDQARERYVSRMVIRWGVKGDQRDFVRELKAALAPFRNGNCSICLLYRSGDAAARLQFGPEWSVRPTRELLQRLTGLVGRKRIRLVYPRRISVQAGD